MGGGGRGQECGLVVASASSWGRVVTLARTWLGATLASVRTSSGAGRYGGGSEGLSCCGGVDSVQVWGYVGGEAVGGHRAARRGGAARGKG